MLIPSIIITREDLVNEKCEPLMNCNIYADRLECHPESLDHVLEGLQQAFPETLFEIYSQREWMEMKSRQG